MKTKDECLPIELVNVSITPAAEAAIEEAGQTIESFLSIHQWGDWGDMPDEDRALYDRALIKGSTVESVFTTKNLSPVWVYTAIGQYTQVYLPDER